MLTSLLSLRQQQKRLLAKTIEEPLKTYLQTPIPQRKQSLLKTEFLALDFETTGFDPAKEAILSVGYTVIRNGKVILAENGHHIVQVNKQIPRESVAIHKITDDRSREGQHLTEIMGKLLHKMTGRVLIAHYAPIEKGFLNAACQALYGHKLPMRILDTLAIEKKRMLRRQQAPIANQLRLFNLRKQYGLPRYKAHNALEDAIATAELFLVQMAYSNRDIRKLTLKDLS
jgi:DNA polymerase-3 subunit epsilon